MRQSSADLRQFDKRHNVSQTSVQRQSVTFTLPAVLAGLEW
jgi:hypothetical protein